MAPIADPDIGFSPKNPEGYQDSTAFQALKNAQRAEYGYRPLVYICSPYSGDTNSNIELARQICAHAVSAKKIPFAPHLLFPQFMNDEDLDERELAMFFNRILLSHCEAMWVYTPRVSTGMRAEIEWAHALDMPIRYIDENFGEVIV